MIDLPGPGWSPGPVEPGGAGPHRRRGLLIILAVVLVVVLIAALINQYRIRSGSPARTSSPPLSTQPSAPGAGASPGQGQMPGQGPAQGALPAVSCPLIRDEVSHLSYRCIDNYLREDGSDIYLGLRIALNHEVEPGWVVSEGSGNADAVAPPVSGNLVSLRRASSVSPVALPTQQDVVTAVQDRTAVALALAYGDGPSARTLSAKPRAFAGVQGYELLTEVTINPNYRQANHLKVQKERLWVVGLPTSVGVSIFMMSIPDDRADLWPKAETTVGTVRVI